jgi:hypothetical protein
MVFLAPCKIPERWIYHTTILILGPKFRFWAWRLIFAFLTPKNMLFLAPCKIPERWIYHTTILFWAPNSVFGLWRLIFTFLIPKNMFFLAPCKIPERWIYHTIMLILGPKFRFWALRAYFFLFDPWKYIFSSIFIYIQIPIDWWVTWPISFLSPPSAQPRDPADSKIFGLRTLSII